MSDAIELVHLRQERDILLASAERKAKAIEATESRYGLGVRPSWVSADIGMDEIHLRDYQSRAREIQIRIDALEKKLAGRA